ncbi:MAG TPA: ABC-type transport auxiliary lipoprotein family protein [Methylocella sp.]|nr:ABC-type transport auxiliary lipoprotein family protein [Methylocella sp.]
METRARYILIGLFVFATILGGFGFVYWMHTIGGLGERSVYRIRFENSVSGLRVGAAVLFDGIRVGEVTNLRLNRENPQQVLVTVSVERDTPIKADSQVRIDVQGLMGSPVVSLQGGSPALPSLAPVHGEPPLLVAGASAGQDLTQAAREVLARIDKILAENSDPLHDTITNIDAFSAVLARNSGRIDGILAGLEKMTGGTSKPPLPTFDLTAPRTTVPPSKRPGKQLVIADPTTLVANDTQRILLSGPGGARSFLEGAQWADSLPKLFQAKIVESFENANSFSGVGRPSDNLTADYQLLLDLREFQVSLGPPPKAEIEFIAKILSQGGRIIDSRAFHAEVPVTSMQAASVVEALNEAFMRSATELVLWTSQKI